MTRKIVYSVTSSKEWRKKGAKHISATQSYPWMPHVIVLDESKGRLYIGQISLEDFEKEKERKNWRLVRNFKFEKVRSTSA